jgi:hypothetical protein
MCEKYINIHIKCNVSSTCNILNLFCVEEYVGGLGQLFCFPRKIVKFPIHFCLVYYTGRYKVWQQLNISRMVSRKTLRFGKELRAFKFYSFQFFQFYTFICFRDTRLTGIFFKWQQRLIL